MPTKIMLPLVLIIGAVGWLAFSNMSKANYFYNVDEMPEFGNPVYKHGLKVKGRVVIGSIDKTTRPVKFRIHENDKELRVHYVGTEPLPDMFKDRAEAVVEGKLNADGIFEATHLQAKCASKYEAGAPEAGEGQAVTTQPKVEDSNATPAPSY